MWRINSEVDSNGSQSQKCSYLGSKVLWRSTEGFHGSSVCDALLAQAKVRDLHVSVLIQHQVLQLRATARQQQLSGLIRTQRDNRDEGACK